MAKTIAMVAGDGIGPEIIDSARRVINKVTKCGFNMPHVWAGGAAIDKFGVPLPEESLEICKSADAVILAAVGGPKWESLPGNLRPERALLELRSQLGLYCNLRPAVLYPALSAACPLKAERIAGGLDVMIVRELTGGIYFGERGRGKDKNGEFAYDVEKYSVYEIERIGRRAFELAMLRNKKLTSVDKANVLESSRLWREVMHRLSREYPEVDYSDLYVDNCAMQLVINPAQFDVIVTSNMFGDILSDEASMLTGSIGMLPSASLGDGRSGMYEPIHGSAPDIAGKGLANPTAIIASAAMMFRYSLKMPEVALEIETGIKNAITYGHTTPDIGGKLSTTEMTDAILTFITPVSNISNKEARDF